MQACVSFPLSQVARGRRLWCTPCLLWQACPIIWLLSIAVVIMSELRPRLLSLAMDLLICGWPCTTVRCFLFVVKVALEQFYWIHLLVGEPLLEIRTLSGEGIIVLPFQPLAGLAQLVLLLQKLVSLLPEGLTSLLSIPSRRLPDAGLFSSFSTSLSRILLILVNHFRVC